MKTVLKLICLSTMMLGGALHAMESDAIELGKLLVLAANQQDWPRVEELIAAGADVSRDDYYGQTALMVAAEEGNLKIAQMLIAAGADVNQQSKNGWTALMFAAFNNNLEMTQMLIGAGADVNQQNENGRTALMLAAKFCNTGIAQMLIAAGADVSQQNNDGNTALMIAAVNNSLKIARMIINAHADLYEKNNKGWTALAMAANASHAEVARMLIDAMLAHPIDPSKAPKALTEEQKKVIYTLALSLEKGNAAKFVAPDLRPVILKHLATVFRQQNYVRDQINSIKDYYDMKAKLLAYFESKIKNEKEEK